MLVCCFNLDTMILAVLALITLGSAAWASPSKPPTRATTPFSNKIIFVPPANYTDPRVLYPRTVELRDGTLLATWENYSPEPPIVYFPIYQSSDAGVTWKPLSRIVDTVNNWGLRYQPFLYELPSDFAGFAAGTVLAAGNSIPTDLSKTQIDVYASTDKGLTWTFLSHVAAGGRAVPNNGETPVWEPFLMMYQSQLVLYYSDQRDPAHGQKLVHQTTRDLKAWDAPADDVAAPAYAGRPGMTTVARLPDGRYALTYEFCNPPAGTPGGGCPVFIRFSADPLRFASAPAQQIAAGSTRPSGSPYVVWSSVGGANGTIVVSSGGSKQVFVNRALGDAGRWEVVDVPQPAAYTRHLRVLNGDPASLLIMGAGKLPPSTTNQVSLSVVDLKALLKIS